eukprot:560311-Rhodomonas_salina.2
MLRPGPPRRRSTRPASRRKPTSSARRGSRYVLPAYARAMRSPRLRARVVLGCGFSRFDIIRMRASPQQWQVT